MKRSSCTLLPVLVPFRAAVTFCALATCNSAFAATPVGGFITTDTHWQAGGSPFIATSSLLVDSGATLTIDPGVEVRFAPTTGLVIVNGTLLARGSSPSPITFTADQPGDVNRWNGIRFGNSTVDAVFDNNGNYLSGSIVENATIEGIAKHTIGSIRIENAAPFFHSCIIQDNLSTGILALNVNGLRVTSNEIRQNRFVESIGGGGVQISSGHGVIISDNEITDNYATYRGGGIYIEDGSDNVINGNTIARNFGGEWGAGLDTRNEDNLSILGNTISDNEGQSSRSAGVYFESGDDITLINNVITGNNTTAGLRVEGITGLSLQGDRIVGNAGAGIHFQENVTNTVVSASASNPTVIHSNGGYEIFNNQFFEATTDPLARGNVDARNVWWGTTDMPTIEAGIFDFFDNSFKGIVFIDPIALTGPLDGDFNKDGAVDAADYVVWRKKRGTAEEFNTWRANFGTSLANGDGSASTNVPESKSLLLAIHGLAMIVVRSCFARRR